MTYFIVLSLTIRGIPMKSLLIQDLHVKVEEKEILKGVNLEIKPGDTLALLGPNGHGKSTLINAIMGHPKYVVTKGSIIVDGVDITNFTPDERSKMGLFLAMQYPSEVPGVINADFLRAAINAHKEKPLSLYQFYRLLDNATKQLNMPLDLANRNLNEGFSGGEKKRNEILQMLLIQPHYCLLDEIDSGLDVDAINDVAKVITDMQSNERSFLIISHYARLFNLVNPNRSAVMINGKIVLEGGKELIQRIDRFGYEFLKTEYGINIEKDEKPMNAISIGVCATKEASKNVK